MPNYYGGRQKPSNPNARLNRSHKLADGLLECYPFAQPLAYSDSIDPTQRITTNSFTLVFDEGAGYGLKSTVDTSGAGNIHVPSPHNISAADFTIQFIFKPNVINAAGSSYTLIKGGEVQLFYSTAGAISTLRIGGTDVTSLSSSSTIQAGTAAIIHITRAGSAGLLYSFGKKDGSFVSSGVTGGSGSLGLNGDGGRGNPGQNTFISWALWGRALSPNEVAELAFDPYCMLRASRSFVFAGASGTANPLTVAARAAVLSAAGARVIGKVSPGTTSPAAGAQQRTSAKGLTAAASPLGASILKSVGRLRTATSASGAAATGRNVGSLLSAGMAAAAAAGTRAASRGLSAVSAVFAGLRTGSYIPAGIAYPLAVAARSAVLAAAGAKAIARSRTGTSRPATAALGRSIGKGLAAAVPALAGSLRRAIARAITAILQAFGATVVAPPPPPAPYNPDVFLSGKFEASEGLRGEFDAGEVLDGEFDNSENLRGRF